MASWALYEGTTYGVNGTIDHIVNTAVAWENTDFVV